MGQEIFPWKLSPTEVSGGEKGVWGAEKRGAPQETTSVVCRGRVSSRLLLWARPRSAAECGTERLRPLPPGVLGNGNQAVLPALLNGHACRDEVRATRLARRDL